MELPPHTHTTVFRHHGMLSTFDFENFVGAASWSQVSFHWNVMCPWTPLDLPACKELLLDVLEVVLSQGGGDFANSHSSQFIWAGPYTIFRLIEYPTTCCSHTLSAAEWHTRFWCAYTSITMEHHLAARTNAFFTFLLPLACHVPWSTHRVLTGCSLGAHLVLTWCSLGAHRVLTGCSLGAHWPNLAARPWCIYRVAPQFPTMKNMHFAAEGYQKIDVPEHRMVYNICCERNTTPAKHFETRLKRIRNALKNLCNAFVTLL